MEYELRDPVNTFGGKTAQTPGSLPHCHTEVRRAAAVTLQGVQEAHQLGTPNTASVYGQQPAGALAVGSVSTAAIPDSVYQLNGFSSCGVSPRGVR